MQVLFVLRTEEGSLPNAVTGPHGETGQMSVGADVRLERLGCPGDLYLYPLLAFHTMR